MNCPTCNTKLEKHDPSACLDAWFIQVVLRKKVKEIDGILAYWDDKAGIPHWKCVTWKNPSSNITDAMEGVEKWKESSEPPEVFGECFLKCTDPSILPSLDRTTEALAEDILYRLTALGLTRALIMWAGKGGGDDQEKS